MVGQVHWGIISTWYGLLREYFGYNGYSGNSGNNLHPLSNLHPLELRRRKAGMREIY